MRESGDRSQESGGTEGTRKPCPAARSFADLIVWQKAHAFVLNTYRLTAQFPHTEVYGLTSQLRRAAVSIPANIAEGNGRWHKKERKEFFWIARGSLQECVPLLEICRRRGLIASEAHENFKQRIEEIARMLAGLINGLD